MYEDVPGKSTEIAYIDESYDGTLFVMVAMIVPTSHWREAFSEVKQFRAELKRQRHIFTSKELHATEFVAGRGRIAPMVIPKAARGAIFRECIDLVGRLPGVRLISGAWPTYGLSSSHVHGRAFSRIQERLQRRSRSRQSQIIVVVDEGRQKELEAVARRSKVFNPVGSQFGSWEDGSSYKNIPNDRLIEDPVFKPSNRSYFLQLVDFVAFALLKSEVAPTPNIERLGLVDAFDRLRHVCATEAARGDPRQMGIVRT